MLAKHLYRPFKGFLRVYIDADKYVKGAKGCVRDSVACTCVCFTSALIMRVAKSCEQLPPLQKMNKICMVILPREIHMFSTTVIGMCVRFFLVLLL